MKIKCKKCGEIATEDYEINEFFSKKIDCGGEHCKETNKSLGTGCYRCKKCNEPCCGLPGFRYT